MEQHLSTRGPYDPEDVLIVSAASRILAEIVVWTLRARVPDLDIEGWVDAATTEIFASCQDVAACAIFSHTGRMP